MTITFLYGPRYLAPLRYLVLFLRTLFLLSTKGPEVVYAQNPPVFCPLACLFYCRAAKARLVIDHHSIWSVKTLGNSPVSTVIGMLERFVARAAHANTAPHAVWGRMLVEVGARNVGVIHDFVKKNPHARDESLRERYSRDGIIAIASHGGHPLERIEEEAAAVALNSSVTLLVTGPPEKLSHRIGERLPANVRYLGLLEREEYEKLKASADFAVNVTDEPYTLSHVLFEYAASSLPTISSRQEVVEEIFGDSLLYADSSDPADVAERVKQFANDEIRRQYRSLIQSKFEELAKLRSGELQALRRLLSSP
ncbi:MAG: glycosyltransferase [Thaumarchaeota archaeon]|nr:glycosyltransferase [Nitrososphaerota archaeon]